MAERVKELQEMIEAVVIGINRETQAHQFYLNLLRRARTEGSKQMFQYLSEQEQMHRLKLETLLTDLKAELILERAKSRK